MGFLLVDFGFLVAYVAACAVIIGLGQYPFNWWFDTGHPCFCKGEDSLYGDAFYKERSGCPRHNYATSNRHFAIGAILGFAVVIANFILMLELFHYFHIWR